jgi:hypothetical protein
MSKLASLLMPCLRLLVILSGLQPALKYRLQDSSEQYPSAPHIPPTLRFPLTKTDSCCRIDDNLAQGSYWSNTACLGRLRGPC